MVEYWHIAKVSAELCPATITVRQGQRAGDIIVRQIQRAGDIIALECAAAAGLCHAYYHVASKGHACLRITVMSDRTDYFTFIWSDARLNQSFGLSILPHTS